MKNLFVKDLKPGDEVIEFFVLRKKELKEYDTKKFLRLELGDKSGRIDAVTWNEPVQLYKLAELGDIVKINGSVGTYKERPQINLKGLMKAKSGEFDLSDLLASSSEDSDVLLGKFKQKCLSIENQCLKALLSDLTGDVDLMEKLKIAPAGKLWHHCYLGGLLEHTLGVVSLCELIAQNYKSIDIDRDLLLTGALLHDIGKIEEYSVGGFIERSDEGRFIGHIVSGNELIALRIKKIDGFPNNLSLKLKHLILSHHGELEYASPVVPQTIEAIILYFADELDSKLNALSRIINESRDLGKRWSDWIKLMRRYIYIGENTLEESESGSRGMEE